ncbi:MAG: uroporphyrinogen-III synthase [Gemmatimonadetes bacterium]|nr:uroporphyrinogen-III synthase [Gemmatimonadota bacterium]
MDLDWFEAKPLFGKTIAMTRARTQASELVQMLRALGAQVLEVPTIAFSEPENWCDVDDAISDIHSYDWLVLTSTNGTDRFFERLFKQSRDIRALGEVKIATIGAATSARVREWRLNVDLEAVNRTSEGLLAAFGADLSRQDFLLPRPEESRDVLANKLRERGAEVRELVVYKTVMPKCLPEEFLQLVEKEAIDLIAFTSSSTVVNLASLLKKARQNWQYLPAACIGPITAQTAVSQGFDVVVELDETSVSISGLVKAIVTYFR